MERQIELTDHQQEFIHGCLEAAGWDDAGVGEQLIMLLENTKRIILVVEEP